MILAILAHKFLGLRILGPGWWIGGGILAGLGIGILWLRNFPTRVQVGLLLDERLGLKERFTTVLSLQDCDDSFARSACREAMEVIGQVQVKHCIPLRFSQKWFWVATLWLLLAGLNTWLPQKDLLGLLARKQQRQDRQVRLQQTRKEIATLAASVKQETPRLKQPGLDKDLQQLQAALHQADPNTARRQAIRALGDMSTKLQQRLTLQQQSSQQLKQLLRQLRGMPQALSQPLHWALAQGRFDQAAALLRSLQQQMEQGRMSPNQRGRLQRQLQDLARQLQQLSQQQQTSLEKTLIQFGLDPKIARMDQDQARKALKKAGINSEHVKKLMQQLAAAARSAQLAQALGSGGDGTMESGDLSQAIAALDQQDAFNKDAALSAAMLAELRRNIGRMGQGLCKADGTSPPTEKEQKGIGTGAAGGYQVPVDQPVTYQKTKAPSKTQSGPVVASWYFQGQPVKGQAHRSIEQVFSEAAQQASEAVASHRIPKKYEAPVKGYFSQMPQPTKSETVPPTGP